MAAIAFNALMEDGSTYTIKGLLGKGDSNAKLNKSDKAKKGFLSVGLSLSPAKESGYEVCASRSPGCTKACLFTAGHGVYKPVKTARIAKTRFFFQNRGLFLKVLKEELAYYQKRANKQGKLLACRLNVLSDIMWENICPELFTMFPNIQFYDYTKHFKRAIAYSSCIKNGDLSFPANYHLTFSRSETNHDEVEYLIRYDLPINIAVVFDNKDIPEYYMGRKVINGDETDLRFLDKVGTIVGLYAKGRGKKDNSGFVVQIGLIQR